MVSFRYNPQNITVAQLLHSHGMLPEPNINYFICNKQDYSNPVHWIDVLPDDLVEPQELWMIIQNPEFPNNPIVFPIAQ